MPKYVVEVEFTQTRRKEITVYAKDEASAEGKAVDIVLGWDDVTDAEAISVDEE